jgi:hypothetical protein
MLEAVADQTTLAELDQAEQQVTAAQQAVKEQLQVMLLLTQVVDQVVLDILYQVLMVILTLEQADQVLLLFVTQTPLAQWHLRLVLPMPTQVGFTPMCSPALA